MPKLSRARHEGFSLIELIVVIVMVGILAAIAVPDYTQYQMREQMKTSVTLAQATFAEAFAQSRAQSQNQVVTVCDNGIRYCNEPSGTTVVVDCNLLSPPPLYSTKCEFAELPSNMSIGPTAIVGTSWKYLGPHGDLDLTSEVELEFEHTMGDIKKIKLHHRSGLIEEQR